MGLLSQVRNHRVYLDANIFIYAIEDLAPWAALAQSLLVFASDGDCVAVTSELTLTECLVGPLRQGHEAAILAFEEALVSRPGLEIVAVIREILLESARIRTRTKMSVPDAIHVATAKLLACDLIITNDLRLKGEEIQVLNLKDIVVE